MTSDFMQPWPSVNTLRGSTPTAIAWDGTIGFAYLDDGGVFADDTVDANSAAANDVPLMPAAPALNDAFYFGEGFATSGPFNALRITLGTAGVGGTIAWEYYNGAVWAALAVTDGTNGFLTAGTNYVTWTIPADMGHVAVNGQDRYWVRARVLTAFAPIPLATQIWLGRYPTSLSNATDGSITTATGQGTMTLSAANYTGSFVFDLGVQKTAIWSGFLGLWTSASTLYVFCEESTDGVTYYSHNLLSPLLTTVSATEISYSMNAVITNTRYVRFRFYVGAAATVNVKAYEFKAYQLEP